MHFTPDRKYLTDALGQLVEMDEEGDVPLESFATIVYSGERLPVVFDGSVFIRERMVSWGSVFMFKIAPGVIVVMQCVYGLLPFCEYTLETFPLTFVFYYEPQSEGVIQLNYCSRARLTQFKDKKERELLCVINSFIYGEGNERSQLLVKEFFDKIILTS